MSPSFGAGESQKFARTGFPYVFKISLISPCCKLDNVGFFQYFDYKILKTIIMLALPTPSVFSLFFSIDLTLN